MFKSIPQALEFLDRWNLVRFPEDELTPLADKYGSDKGLMHPAPHFYTHHYARYFRRLRPRPLLLLEIGLLGKFWQDFVYGQRTFAETYSGRGRDRHDDAPSLRMWSEYFPKAQIVGLDIHDFSAVSIPRCRTMICDQGDPASLRSVLDAIATPPNVVIDDGSHASEHQQRSLFTIFPRLSSGGIYVIEDLQWQPPDIGDQSFPTTLSLFDDFPNSLRRSPCYSADNALEDTIASVEVLDSITLKRNIVFLTKR